ncbi:YheC/D-like protein [Paenibacillus methanolicus]|uniref:YheC/D-like protein n=1 Tax=Paenibacillus methanolicus TaxID=582686 RepID=A0A5S5C7R2_9BACL|nr:YheC/YheD family protein [Paenibacillus methanolicus]TYP75384.1 YheC/D-like protein [Paenibacillus methanolicus]
MSIQKDKWLQYRILRNRSSLAGRLPETRLLQKKALSKMLLQYRSVVLKPRDGSYGRDIVFMRRNGANAYRIQNENNGATIRGTGKVLQWLRHKKRSRGYIVQRRLHLARIRRKPFDIRIMTQRKKGAASPWTVTGSYAKVAARGYLVTNVASRTMPVIEALKLAGIGDRRLLVQAERIALSAAQRLGERYPKLRQVGFDIGIDSNRRIWIIEGNYRPDVRPFRRLQDRAMYRRILRYKK